MNNENVDNAITSQRFSEDEARKLLGVGLSTLRRIRAQGSIAFYRFNRKIYFSNKHLMDYLQRHEVKSAADKPTIKKR